MIPFKKSLFVLKLSIFLFFSSCSIKPNNEFKENNFYQKFNLINYDKIIVLTDIGCINCNRKLVTVLAKIKNKKNRFIFIESSGTVYDISELIDSSFKNKTLLYKREASKYFKIRESTFIFFENKKQKMISVTPENIDLIINMLE